jgi:hypothetical protein
MLEDDNLANLVAEASDSLIPETAAFLEPNGL